MIQVQIIPDGSPQVPPELTDDSVVSSYLRSADIPAVSGTEFDGWRDIARINYGTRERVAIQIPGTLEDYSSSQLDRITSPIVNNVNGVKVHPDGWEEIDEE